MMLLNNYEFRVETRTNNNKTIWCCRLKDKFRCKSRLLSWNDTLYIKSSVEHCHPPPNVYPIGLMEMETVKVKYVDSFKHIMK